MATMTMENDVASLHDQMDALWTRYLSALDKYITAQAAIKKELSSGFFSLAQANFKSSGRRYGQDYYDQRAIAITRVNVVEAEEDTTLQIVRHLPKQTTAGNQNENDDEKDTKDPLNVSEDPSKENKPTQLRSPSPTPEPETFASSEKSSSHERPEEPVKDANDAKAEERKLAIDSRDPIRWFGILVPPPLRSAQKSFSSAVRDEHGIAKAVNAARDMREIEAQIRKLRKTLKKAEKGTLGVGTGED